MKFYPGKELGNDPSNWWAPNMICLDGMLKSNGFHDYKVVDRSKSAADYRVTLICQDKNV